MFYESHNSLQTDLIKTQTGTDYSFPPHLHSSFEFITVTEGVLAVTVDKQAYELHAGEALLVFPNQVHELISTEHNCHFLCIFAPQLVQAYSKVFLSKVPVCSLFRPHPFYLSQMLAIQEGALGTVQIKGLLYSLCGDFDRGAVYLPKNTPREDLLAKIFRFVEENYSRDCSLKDLAAHTSYHYVYLSRVFKQYTGLSFTEYVNRYRIGEAGYLLRNGERSILQIAFDCGFDSLRSFNRNFKRITGETPGEYRTRL